MCQSIAQTVAEVEQKFVDGPVVRLNEHKIVQLSETTALIGIDGFADGRGGLGRKTSFRINDSIYIRDLCDAANQDLLFEKMEELGDQSAQALNKGLPPTLEKFDTVFVVTHVPPFPEACKYNGKPNPDDSMPFFCNQVFGEELLKIARRYPSKKIIVLSGHTHDRAFHVIENIEVHVAGAEYRFPTIEKLFDIK
jgi:hypothetical protein